MTWRNCCSRSGVSVLAAGASLPAGATDGSSPADDGADAVVVGSAKIDGGEAGGRQAAAGPALPNFILPGRKAFLTSATGTGNLGSWPGANGQSGIAAGDEICQRPAPGAGSKSRGMSNCLSFAEPNQPARAGSSPKWRRLT